MSEAEQNKRFALLSCKCWDQAGKRVLFVQGLPAGLGKVLDRNQRSRQAAAVRLQHVSDTILPLTGQPSSLHPTNFHNRIHKIQACAHRERHTHTHTHTNPKNKYLLIRYHRFCISGVKGYCMYLDIMMTHL